MQNKSKHISLKLAATCVLSSALLGGCAGSRTAKESAAEPQEKADSVKEFPHTHPPVVIPYTWQEAMQKATPPDQKQDK